MECRPGCSACCIALSISSPIPGMPEGKPPGVRCVNLSEENLCTIHDQENYPAVCREFRATEELCGTSSEYAMASLSELERATSPQ